MARRITRRLELYALHVRPVNVWGLRQWGVRTDPLKAPAFSTRPVVTDSHGNTFVADTENSTIRMITADGAMVSTFAARPACSGAATAPEPPPFLQSGSLALTRRTTFMCPTPGITQFGRFHRRCGGDFRRVAAQRIRGRHGSAARFDFPIGITVDSTATSIVTDSANTPCE